MTREQMSDRSGELVFKPVPTEEDFTSMAHDVQRARSGRAQLFIAVIFLSGIVVAAAIGMALLGQHAATATQNAEVQIAELNRVIRERDSEIAAQKQLIAQKNNQLSNYAAFQSIIALQDQSDALEREIAQLLNEPSRAGAPARLTRLPPEVEWLDRTVPALTNRRDELLRLREDVRAWPPAPVSPRPD